MIYSLRTLEAKFKRTFVADAGPHIGRQLPDGTTQWGGFDTDYFATVELLSQAQGIWFLCPLCFEKNGGAVGTHSILIWFDGCGAPERMGKDSTGKTVRWTIVDGTGLDDLQLSPSILLAPPCCGWHGFIGSSGIPAGHAG